MMSSRERVAAAINFREPDRVPLDLGGLKASGIAVETYRRLRDALGLPGPVRVLDARFMVAVPDDDIRRRFHIDTAPLDLSTVAALAAPEQAWVKRRLFSGMEALFPPGTRIAENPDGSWMLLDDAGKPTAYRMPPGGHYFDDLSFDHAGERPDPAAFRPIDDIPDATLELMRRGARHLHDETDYALLGWGGGVCFLGMSLITERRSNVTMGLPSEWMMMLMTEKETCHEMMGRAVDASIQCLTLLHQAVGDRCFAWGIAADDSGTQRGEFVRPELWAEMIKPHYRRLCDWIHAHTAWKTFFHSCGSVYNLIPHFIDAGIDILNPVQTSAANMEPARLKAEFGKKIVFWGGGCDTQSVLCRSTPDEIRRHVAERIGVFAPGGGFIFNQVHNIQADVPEQNVIAMLDAAYEFGAMPPR